MTKDGKGAPEQTLETLIARIEELEKTLESTQQEREEKKSAQLRALADLQNFQRRESENKKNWSTFAVSDFLIQILPRLTELRLSGEHTKDEHVKKTMHHFFQALGKAELSIIDPKKGDAVDPEIHEVIMAEEGKKGTVVRVLEIGWKLGDRVLKPAKVSAPHE